MLVNMTTYDSIMKIGGFVHLRIENIAGPLLLWLEVQVSVIRGNQLI